MIKIQMNPVKEEQGKEYYVGLGWGWLSVTGQLLPWSVWVPWCYWVKSLAPGLKQELTRLFYFHKDPEQCHHRHGHQGHSTEGPSQSVRNPLNTVKQARSVSWTSGPATLRACGGRGVQGLRNVWRHWSLRTGNLAVCAAPKQLWKDNSH